MNVGVYRRTKIGPYVEGASTPVDTPVEAR